MRELIGQMATSEPGVTRSVYRSEMIRCGECQKMAPIGIEVITARKDGDSRKVLEHRYYCRSHGLDYELRSESQPLPPRHSKKQDGQRSLLAQLF